MPLKKPKIVVVTGGVYSGLGKGVAAASIGRILKSKGFTVTAMKIDPYINYDAGNLNPYEHGEVFVTKDGGEIDMDFGHYERIMDIDVGKENNITTGKVYSSVIQDERKLKYEGKTVQLFPHISNEVKRRVRNVYENEGADFMIIEIGGTVGDEENRIFMKALGEMKVEGEDIVTVHVVALPYNEAVGEQKTKPAQHSVKALKEFWNPDFLIVRGTIDKLRKEKLSILCGVMPEKIIEDPDVKCVYELPLEFEKQNLGEKILKEFKMEPRKTDMEDLKSYVYKNLDKKVNIAIIGKYYKYKETEIKHEHSDAYVSVEEALKHAGVYLGADVNITRVFTGDLKKMQDPKSFLLKFDGIVVPGGYGKSGADEKIFAIKTARENNIPFLGLCFGMQLGVIEFARNVCGLTDADTTETNPDTKHPVIDIMPSQIDILKNENYGGTQRLGNYVANMKKSEILNWYEKTGRLEEDMKIIRKLKNENPDSMLYVEEPAVIERHRHRYEVNPKFVKILEENGMVFAGKHIRKDKQELMEFFEVPKNSCHIATQSHPEFRSRPNKPSPMYVQFIYHALNRQRN